MESKNEQLWLRAPEPEDLEFMVNMENLEEMMSVGIATGPYSRYQIKQYIASNENDIYTDRQVRFVVEHSEYGAVGIVDLFSFDPRAGKVEIGLAVAPDRRRRGIAAGALRQIENYCFGFLNIHQIYAFIAVDNTACIQLFTQHGYVNKGVMTDWLCMGLQYKDVCFMQKIR